MSPEVTIIVPAYRNADLLGRCLAALRQHAARADVVVVLNGVPADVRAIADDASWARVVDAGVNVGFAGGCNLGVASCETPVVGFVNDDAEVTAGWLDALLEVLRAEPSVGLVGSLQLAPDGRVLDAGSTVEDDGRIVTRGRGLPREELALTGDDVDYMSAAAVLVRREAWDAVGGMDEGFFPAYYEDVDLGLRLRDAGWCCRFEPGAVVVHNESASLDERRKVLAHRLGEARFRARWFGAGEPPPCRQFTDHGERMLSAARAGAEFERRLADELAAELDEAVAARDWAQGELDRLQPLYHRHAAESAARESLLAETAAEVERLRAALQAAGDGDDDRPRRRWLR